MCTAYMLQEALRNSAQHCKLQTLADTIVLNIDMMYCRIFALSDFALAAGDGVSSTKF